MEMWKIILTAAGTSAFVTSVFGFIAQHLERRERRKLQLAMRAYDAAVKFNETATLVKGKTALADPMLLAGSYYRALKGLFEDGELPDDWPSAEDHKHLERSERI